MSNEPLKKSGTTYLIGSLLTNMLSLILIPLLTRSLSTADIGLYSLWISVFGLLSILTSLGIHSGMARHFYEYEDLTKLKAVTLTGIIVLGLVFGSLCVVGILISKVFYIALSSATLKIASFVFLSSVLATILTTYATYYAMRYMAFRSVIVQLIRSGSLLLTTFVVILVGGATLEHVMLAQVVSLAVAVMIMFAYDFRELSIHFDAKLIKSELSYGIGLLPGLVGIWILDMIDRYFLRLYTTLGTVGIYSISYKVGMLFQPLMLIPFTKVFTAYKFKHYADHDGPEKIVRLLRVYNLIAWFVMFGLSVFAKVGLFILGSETYISGFYMVPFVAMSYYLWGLNEFYALGLHIEKKMKTHSLIMISGALSNVLLNAWLVPRFDVLGALFATVFSYLLMTIVYERMGKKYYDLKVSFAYSFKFGLSFMVIYPVYLLLTKADTGLFYEFSLAFFCLCLYGGVLLVTKQVTKEEVSQLLRVKSTNR